METLQRLGVLTPNKNELILQLGCAVVVFMNVEIKFSGLFI